MSLIVPAVLAPSRAAFERDLALFTSLPGVSRVQIDVVDGKYAAPASWPYSVETTKGAPYTAPRDLQGMIERGEMLPHLDRVAYEIDLMCFDAEHAAEEWLALGATRLTFHAGSTTDLARLLAFIHGRYGAGNGFASNLLVFGIAVDVASDLSAVERHLGGAAYVQFMGIEHIGRQGQPFDRRVLEKVRVFHKRHPEVPIQVDGGVSLQHARELSALGASSLVVGSGILNARDPGAALAAYEAIKSPYGV